MKTIETRDSFLMAFLIARGVRYVGAEARRGTVYFFFSDVDGKATAALAEWQSHLAVVNVSQYCEALRQARALLTLNKRALLPQAR